MGSNYQTIREAVSGTRVDLVIKPVGSPNFPEENYKLLGDIGAISKLDSEVKKWVKFLPLEIRSVGDRHYICVLQKDVVEQELVMPVKLGYYKDAPFYIDHLFHHLLICGMPRQGKSTLTHLHLLYVLENYGNAEIVLIASTKREFSQDLKQLRYPIAHDVNDASRYLSDIKQELLDREDNGFENKPPIFIYMDEAWELTENYPKFNELLSYIVRKGARNQIYLVMNLHTPKATVMDSLISGNCLALSFYQSKSVNYRVSLGQVPNGKLAPQQFAIDYDGLKVIQLEKASYSQLQERYSPHVGDSVVDSGILPITDEENSYIETARACAESNNGLISVGKIKEFANIGKPKARIVFDTLERHGYVDDSLAKVNQQWQFLDK